MTQVVKPNFSNAKINNNQPNYMYSGKTIDLNLSNDNITYNIPDYSYTEKLPEISIYEKDGVTRSLFELGDYKYVPQNSGMIKNIFESDGPIRKGIQFLSDWNKKERKSTEEKAKEYYGENQMDDSSNAPIGYFKGRLQVQVDEQGNKKYLRYDRENGTIKPISPFDEENLEFDQYGGNHCKFLDNFDELIKDPIIWAEMQKYFPVESFASEEEAMEFYRQYFSTVASTGCGYTGMSNLVFKQYIGREEEFEKKFGYPMYTVKEETGEVDFNYEYVNLEYFNYINADKINKQKDHLGFDEEEGWFVKENGEPLVKGAGYQAQMKAEKFYKEHGIDTDVDMKFLSMNDSDKSEIKVNKQLEKMYQKYDSVMISVQGYDMYDEDGNLFLEEVPCHAMEIVDFKLKKNIHLI